MKKHYNISIHGKVQGVMFRNAARAQAQKLRVRGFVRNNSDGSIYIEAEGEDEDVEQFVTWCHHGPPHADVERIEVVPFHVKNLSTFRLMNTIE